MSSPSSSNTPKNYKHESTAKIPNINYLSATNWPELFFDLVFVVAIVLLSHKLLDNPELASLGSFLLLFFPLWTAWSNFTFTINVYAPYAPWIKFSPLLCIPGITVMAMAIPEGTGQLWWVYAGGSAYVRFVLLGVYLWIRKHSQTSLPLWVPIIYSGFTGLLWLISAFVEPPYAFIFWIAAIVTETALWVYRGKWRGVPWNFDIHYFLERLDAFVLIVFGEIFYVTITGVAEHPSWHGVVAMLSAVGIAITLAIMYFMWKNLYLEPELEAHKLDNDTFALMRDVCIFIPFFTVASVVIMASVMGFAAEYPDKNLNLFQISAFGVSIFVFLFSQQISWVRLGMKDGINHMVQSLIPLALLLLGGKHNFMECAGLDCCYRIPRCDNPYYHPSIYDTDKTK